MLQIRVHEVTVQEEKRVANKMILVVGRLALCKISDPEKSPPLPILQRKTVLPVFLPTLGDKQDTRWSGTWGSLVFVIIAKKIASRADTSQYRSVSRASPASELTFHYRPSSLDLGSRPYLCSVIS